LRLLTTCVIVWVGLCLLAPNRLNAQDVQPKVYTPAPVGVNVIVLAYAFSTGEVLFDKTIPIDNTTGDMHSITAAYSRSIGVLGMAGRADIALPFVSGDWEGDVEKTARAASRTGFGDPVLRLALFPVGAPAMTKKQFAGFQHKTVVGATLRLTLPLGQYDPNKLTNLGSNRWTVSPQVGISHSSGSLSFEANAGVWFFTDNSEFLGTSTLSQDPLFTFQVHASYHFRREFWLAASMRQSVGGATMQDGKDKLASEANNRVGLTLVYPIAGRYAVRFAATTGLTARVGNDYTTLAVSWQVVL